jgi:hypothetical protein
MALAEPQERIDERVRQGGSRAEVEEEIIDPAAYGEEQKAACGFTPQRRCPGTWRRRQPRRLTSRVHS